MVATPRQSLVILNNYQVLRSATTANANRSTASCQKKGICQMNTIEGFFVESGLFLKCPHCKNRTRQNVQSFFLSVHMDKPVTCTKCEKEFTIHVEFRPVVEAVEQSVHPTLLRCPKCNAVAGWHHEACEDYSPETQSG